MVSDPVVPTLLSTTQWYRSSTFASVLLSAVFLILAPLIHVVEAGNVTLAWDPHPDPGITGYSVYMGTASRSYSGSVDAGNATTYTFQNLDDTKTYYFAVTAHNNTLESGFSSEVAFSTSPSSQPSVAVSSATGGGGGGGCFIATAVYGPESREVSILRQFRDHHLLTNGPGRVFVRLYYSYSPAIVRAMDGNPSLQVFGRCMLWPVVYGISHAYAAFSIIGALLIIAIVSGAKFFVVLR
jgi:hypothetical protein